MFTILVNLVINFRPLIPMAARSKLWVCGLSFAGIAGSNPAGFMDILSCDSCVLLGRGLCLGPITRSEEFYGLWFF